MFCMASNDITMMPRQLTSGRHPVCLLPPWWTCTDVSSRLLAYPPHTLYWSAYPGQSYTLRWSPHSSISAICGEVKFRLQGTYHHVWIWPEVERRSVIVDLLSEKIRTGLKMWYLNEERERGGGERNREVLIWTGIDMEAPMQTHWQGMVQPQLIFAFWMLVTTCCAHLVSGTHEKATVDKERKGKPSGWNFSSQAEVSERLESDSREIKCIGEQVRDPFTPANFVDPPTPLLQIITSTSDSHAWKFLLDPPPIVHSSLPTPGTLASSICILPPSKSKFLDPPPTSLKVSGPSTDRTQTFWTIHPSHKLSGPSSHLTKLSGPSTHFTQTFSTPFHSKSSALSPRHHPMITTDGAYTNRTSSLSVIPFPRFSFSFTLCSVPSLYIYTTSAGVQITVLQWDMVKELRPYAVAGLRYQPILARSCTGLKQGRQRSASRSGKVSTCQWYYIAVESKSLYIRSTEEAGYFC